MKVKILNGTFGIILFSFGVACFFLVIDNNATLCKNKDLQGRESQVKK